MVKRRPELELNKDDKIIKEDNRLLFISKLVPVIIVYLLLFILHSRVSAYLGGIIAQLHVLLSIFLTIFLYEAGYITAVILNIIQIAVILLNILFYHKIETIPGLFVAVVVILIITILHLYSKNLRDKIVKIVNQKDELAKLYEKLKESEEELCRQNIILEQNNKELTENADRINRLAFYDSLTGIPNRIQVINRIELLSIASKHKASPFTLVMININNLKSINDTLGPQIGDLVLKLIANELSEVINKKDLLGRFGEEEFALVIPRRISEEKLNLYISQLKAVLQKITSVYKNKISLAPSHGVAAYPKDTSDFMELIMYADAAMSKAKEIGIHNILFFNRKIKEEVIRKIEFENQLLSSIDKNELYLVFQPQFTSKDKNLRGYEALARWNSPAFGEVGPLRFIPVAEENGFIITMGNWILLQACCLFQEYLTIYKLDIKVSVNISAKQIIDPGFIDSVKSALELSGLPPQNLELELTESIMINEVDYVCQILKTLRSIGVLVALDDFGTGYSSLSLLPNLPIDTIKIDKSFIQDIDREEKKSQLIGAIISVAQKMNFFVIAEGIVTDSQLEFLQEHKCDCIQGYLWGRPGELNGIAGNNVITDLEDQEEQAI